MRLAAVVVYVREMRRVLCEPSLRIPRYCALTFGLLVCHVLVGCSEVDSVAAIREQQAAGDYEATIEPLRALLAKRPDDAELNFLYGRALAFTKPNLAMWALREAMKDPEWLVPAGTQLALVALSATDFNEVIEITEDILEREPENVRVLLMQANAYAHSRQNPELALTVARRILEIDPTASEAYEPLILGLLGLDRFEEARAELKEAGRLLDELGMDESVRAWHCSTTAAFAQESGDLEQARETWIACLAEHPTDLDVVSSAVGFYDAHAEPDRSIEILQAALERAPGTQFFRIMLAQRLHAAGDTAAAEAVLLEATRSENPQLAATGWVDLGQFRRAIREYGAAADALEQALEGMGKMGTASPQLQFEFADALVLADRIDRAAEVAEEISVPAHRELIRARVAQKRGDPSGALKAFDEAHRLWPDNPWARYYAALAAEELGDFKRAIEEFRNAVRIEPGATDARTRGAALLLAQGNLNNALIMLHIGRETAPLEIEGQLLAMRLAGLRGDTAAVADNFALIETSHPEWAGQALAEAAEGLAELASPVLAVDMLVTAPGVDFADPRYVAALRALVRFSLEAGETAEMRAALQEIFAAHPDSSVFQALRGLYLELSGAPAEAVNAAYTRALELGPQNAWAMAGLGRMASLDDPEAAFGFFDRAAAADSSDPESKLGAARALIAGGKPDQAAERLDALLLAHPLEAEAAAERARLDLERGATTPQTLERARRAVLFGGGADALELLSRVYAERGEPLLAAQAAEEALAVRAAGASDG
jgi:tetratricopeptide (TPR) repeat protein